MDMYDSGFFENEQIPQEIYDNKNIMLALVMAIPSVLSKFVNRYEDKEEYARLYQLCVTALKRGFLSSENVDDI